MTSIDSENLKIIFGIKIKRFRTDQGLSLQELSTKSGLAVSYLSEIESGKKYPKPDKLIKLSLALGIEYDTLVSLKVGRTLDPFAALINSELLKQFPFNLFGISARDILSLFKNDPDNVKAFLQTFLQISKAYDMSLENFLFAALRTYQQIHLNYFPELEEMALRFREEHNLPGKIVLLNKLKTLLSQKYDYRVEENELTNYPHLDGFRSVLRQERYLSINARLAPSQKAFILAREIGFQELGISKRPLTSSWLKVESFEQLVNNFKASYFGGALLINRQSLTTDISEIFNQKKWDARAFTKLLDTHAATPEMLLYRMSQILPGSFSLHSLFYTRFTNSEDRLRVKLTKELNMTGTLVPYGLGLREHYCRRWLPMRLLQKLRRNGLSLTTGAQIIHFAQSGARFLLLSMARPLSLKAARESAIAIGVKIDAQTEKHIHFLSDPNIDEEVVGETCERCPLRDCSERVVEASIITKEQYNRRRSEALQDFLLHNSQEN